MVDWCINKSTSPLSASNPFVMAALVGREEWIICSLPFTLDLAMGLVWVNKMAVNMKWAWYALIQVWHTFLHFCISAIFTRRTHQHACPRTMRDTGSRVTPADPGRKALETYSAAQTGEQKETWYPLKFSDWYAPLL